MNTPLPAFYIAHGGGPCFFMDWSSIGPRDTWKKMADWLSHIDASLPVKPKAILVVSAHWEENAFTVTSNAHPELIYDYSGFPAETYDLKYPAPGSPELANRIVELLEEHGLQAKKDPVRGFDHGVFIPFKLIYPEASIPVVQLSLKRGLDPALHLELGRALAPLRNEGVLIVGSGMSYHNLRELFGGHAIPESDEFDAWLSETLTPSDFKTRSEKLIHWQSAPKARDAHPREEHLIPLMVVAGAAENEKGVKVFSDRVMGAITSGFSFGS
jgi:aromatic ring-opening dioxygenase catalytic subunit (LigB family)